MGVSGRVFGEIPLIPFEEGGHVAGDDVNFAPNLFALTWPQPTDAEVRVDAMEHPLEKFLIRLPRSRQNRFPVLGKTANQSIARRQRIQRSGIYILPGDSFGTPNLPRGVAGCCGPVGGRHRRQRAQQEDEAVADVVVGGLGRAQAGESADPNAGLCPVCLGRVGRRVVRGQLEVYLIGPGGDGVGDDNAVGQDGCQMQAASVIIRGEELRAVGDGSLRPVACVGGGSAKGFEIVDVD